jgi:hypothetical protein
LKISEPVSKRFSLAKIKAGENFNLKDTVRILRINPPKFGGGLKFQPNTEIGQNGTL